MSDLSTLVIAPITRRTSTDQQMIGGARDFDPAIPGAINWYFPFGAKAVVEGVTSSIAGNTPAQLWPGGVGITLDVVHHAYLIFVLQGSNTLWAARQQDFAPIAAANAVGKIAWVDGNWDLVPQSPGLGTPLIPPTIVTSGSGGSFGIAYGSNPHVVHGNFNAGTKVLSTWWTGFGGGGSIVSQPQPNYVTHEAAGQDMEFTGAFPYPYPVDWHNWDFESYANAGNHWPLPYNEYDPLNSNMYHFADGTLGPYWRWQRWQDPVFNLTSQPAGVTPAFDPTVLWSDSPPFPVAALGKDRGNPTFINEVLLIRGKVFLPPLSPTAVVTSVDWLVRADALFTNDDTRVNALDNTTNRNAVGLGPAAGSTPAGETIVHGLLSTLPYWRFGDVNLVAMSFIGQYWLSPNDHSRSGTWGTASAYIDVAFTIDEGTGNYAPPPTNWQTTGGTFTPDPPVDPGPFFGRGVAFGDSLGDLGPQGRGYYQEHFTLPATPPVTGATLAITAESGIGAIYINNVVIDIRDETTDLWGTNTVLTYTFTPTQLAALVLGGDNILAVQVYSILGPSEIVWQLQVQH